MECYLHIIHYSTFYTLPLGLFRNISSAGSSIVKENLLKSEKLQQVKDTRIKKTHEMFMSLKETCPVLCVQWIQLVFLFGFDDEDWWTSLQGLFCEVVVWVK